MVDIIDMEDIFREIINNSLQEHLGKIIPEEFLSEIRQIISQKLIEEVKDFVDNQKNIACNNCRGLKFKKIITYNR